MNNMSMISKRLCGPLLALAVFSTLTACEEKEPATEKDQPAAVSETTDVIDLTGKIDIQRVVSPLGIEAWLVEEHSIPIIAVNLGFEGGAWLDEPGKEGTSQLLAILLNEGAGDLTSEAFQQIMDEQSIGLYFSASRENLTGSLSTLSANKDRAFDLLRLAVTQPRFDEDPLERMRTELFVQQRQRSVSPNSIAAERLFSELFPGSRYSRPSIGTPESLAGITRGDLDTYRKSYLTQARLKVAVVGDITAEELARRLDEVFGDLPSAGEPRNLEPVPLTVSGQTLVEPFNNPQSSVVFGGPGLMGDDPDFIPMFVVNHILGSGSFTSRLINEVREKRGLTYSIYTEFRPLDRAGMFLGAVASDNAKVAEAIDITKKEIDRLKAEGISEDELNDAKTYLTGAFALRFDSNSKIAGQLLAYQLGDYPLDYINIRNDLVNAVSMDDINRVLARFPGSDEITFVVVGQPQGLPESHPESPAGD